MFLGDYLKTIIKWRSNKERKKESGRLWSIFTDDMNRCIISGYSGIHIERHHVFGGANKKRSELYGFIAPLRYDLHPNGSACYWSDEAKSIDLNLKRSCQWFYEESIGSREEFIKEFGRSYLG